MAMDKISKIATVALIVVIIGVVVIATILKVYNNHKESLFQVVDKRIEEAAKKCSLEEVCTEGTTTLGFLIEKGYLEKQVHPISKEYVDENLSVTCSGYICKTDVEQSS